MSHPRSAYLCLLLFSLACLRIEAQRIVEKTNIELITAAEGLPFNSITGVLQDQTGFLWISSLDGLARYDGYSFLKIPITQLAEQSIGTMTMDHHGNLWLGHLTGLVTKFDPLTMQAHTYPVRESNNSDVTAIHCDRQDQVWCAIRTVGLFLLNKEQEFEFVDKPPDYVLTDAFSQRVLTNNIGAITLHNDSLWVGTSDGLYTLRMSDKKLQLYSRLHEGNDIIVPVQTILPDGDRMWIGTYGSGLIELTIRKKSWRNFLFQKHVIGTTNIINAIARGDNGDLWLATNGKGIGLFKRNDESLSFFYEPDDFNSGPLTNRIIQDRNGIVWASSDKGLHKWNVADNKFAFTSVIPKRSDNGGYYGVNVMLNTDKPKRTLIGVSFADGLHIVDHQGNVFARDFDVLPNAEPYKIVTDINEDSNANVWVLTRDFLYRLTDDNRLIKDQGINRTLPTGTIPHFYRILEGSDGSLMVASSREGFFRKKKNASSWERFTTADKKLLGNRVVRLLEDDKQRIWMLHPLTGITRYHLTTGEFEHITASADSAGLQSNRLSDMSKSADGSIWVSSLEGLAVFKTSDEKVLQLSKNPQLPSNVILSLCADENGAVWITTSLGLSAILPSGQVKTFDHLDGLHGVTSTFSLRRGQNGKMNIFTYKGFFTFDPKTALQETDDGHSTRITHVQINDVAIRNLADGPLTLPHVENSASFSFSALNFRNPQRNVYEYKMDGLENDWKQSNTNSVNYSAMPSGSYTFRVKLAGQTDAQAATLSVTVNTPFWKTYWFITATLLAIGSLLFLLYWLRLRFIRKEEHMKASLNQKLMEVEMKALRAQMSPHFIFNSLNSINRYIVKSDPETASNYLTKFSKLMRLILENSNHKVITLEQELNALKLYIELEALRFNNKFAYNIHVDDDIDATTLGVPPMVIQPFIENAIWHGLLHKETRGTLEITISTAEESIRCTIVDNGIGRRKAAELKSKSVSREKSYGMKITTDRLNMVSGTSHASTVEIIDLTNANGEPTGTKVIVTIPITQLEPEF